MFLTIVNCLSIFTLLVELHVFILLPRIYLHRLVTGRDIIISHRHQCKTRGIICECESHLDCNPDIFMNYICVTCRNYWNFVTLARTKAKTKGEEEN